MLDKQYYISEESIQLRMSLFLNLEQLCGRPESETRVIVNEVALKYEYVYDQLTGKPSVTRYPGNFTTAREYDPYGHLKKIWVDSEVAWELGSVTGKTSTVNLNGLVKTTTLDSNGLPEQIKISKNNTALSNFTYNFNSTTGNLTWRKGIISQQEIFGYDNLNRLKTVHYNNTDTEDNLKMSINYLPNGNIQNKTELGTYSYTEFGPHAIDKIQNTAGLISEEEQTINYTAFNKVSDITEGVYRLDISYGPDLQRNKSILKTNGAVTRKTLYAPNYERITTQYDYTRELYYIRANGNLVAVYEKSSGTASKLYYAHTDHLGSIVKLTNKNGTEFFKATYDAWGQRKVTYGTFHRGFTGHEHLPEFGLINMNGRMYDPLLGRFLSPDPYVSNAEYSQDFNRYSYARNNPLIYKDPDGESIIAILIAVAVFTAIEYGTQVYQNYQINQQMRAAGASEYSLWSNKDIWLKKIDWFDVGISGIAGGLSTAFPAAAPFIKYATPVVQNAFNWYGNGTKQNVFDGSIPLNHYVINTGVDLATTYLISKFHQYNGLYGSKDGITPSPNNSDWYYSWRGNYFENALYSTINSTLEYTWKSRTYVYFNNYDKLPVKNPNIPINYKTVETKNSLYRGKIGSDKNLYYEKFNIDVDFRKYLSLSIVPIK